jgi:ribosome maturation factor RimP
LKPALQDRIREIAHRVAQGEGLELVEIEFVGGGKNRVLRITIDKEHSEIPGQGVTLQDCENVSQQVGTILDVEDVITGSAGYTLEVSSPGVERKLLKESDYQRFAGQKAKVILKEPIEKDKVLIGKLAGVSEGRIQMELDQGRQVQFPFDQVDRANLKFDW